MKRGAVKAARLKISFLFYILFLLVFLSVTFYMFKLCFFVAQIFKLQTLRKVVNKSIFYMSSDLKKENHFLCKSVCARPLSIFILSLKMISYFYTFYKAFM